MEEQLTNHPVTFISLSIILSSMMLEFVDYRRIHVEPSIEVDRSSYIRNMLRK